MHYFEIFVTIMGIIMSFGYFPQAYKIWQTKSAESISLTMYIISAIGTATWCVYGILTNNFVVFISASRRIRFWRHRFVDDFIFNRAIWKTNNIPSE
jgi:MtN3 and saliva related transmembrane protein